MDGTRPSREMLDGVDDLRAEFRNLLEQKIPGKGADDQVRAWIIHVAEFYDDLLDNDALWEQFCMPEVWEDHAGVPNAFDSRNAAYSLLILLIGADRDSRLLVSTFAPMLEQMHDTTLVLGGYCKIIEERGGVAAFATWAGKMRRFAARTRER